MSLAEKFQITTPYIDEGKPDEKWVTPTHHHDGVPQRDDKFNVLPIGYEATSERDKFVHGFGGNTDVSGGLEPEVFVKGFKRRDMKATDDQYGGEHIDLFYGEAVDEKGQVGFAERNNYLDRL
jgi:hypothetical protein